MEMDAIPTNVRAALPAPVKRSTSSKNYQADKPRARIDAMTYPEQRGFYFTHLT